MSGLLGLGYGSGQVEVPTVTGQIELIETKVVSGGAITSFDFATTLSGDADSFYMIEGNIINATGSAAELSLRINGNGASADGTYIVFNGSAVAGGSLATAKICNLNASTDSSFIVEFANPETESFGRRFFARSNANTNQFENYVVRITSPANTTNITSFGIASTVASSIGNGSTIKLYRVKV